MAQQHRFSCMKMSNNATVYQPVTFCSVKGAELSVNITDYMHLIISFPHTQSTTLTHLSTKTRNNDHYFKLVLREILRSESEMHAIERFTSDADLNFKSSEKGSFF